MMLSLGLSDFIDTAINIDILFPDRVSFLKKIKNFKQTLLKSQTLQLVKTQNINIIQNNARGGHNIKSIDKLVNKNVIKCIAQWF